MSGLTFQDFSAGWHTHSVPPIRISVTAPRTALVGDWAAFSAYLAGCPGVSTAGSAWLDGLDARQAVVSGALGLCRRDHVLPENERVAEWLVDYLALGGSSEGAARKQVREVLSDLGLSYLARKVIGTLSAPERYSTRVALALITRPRFALLPAPDAVGPYDSYWIGLWERAAALTSIAVEFVGEPNFELHRWCGHSVVLDAAGQVLTAPFLQAVENCRRYRLQLPAGVGFDAAALEQELKRRGITCDTPASLGAAGSPLHLTLPSAGATDLVLEATLAAGCTLSQLSPLFFARRAG